MRTFFIRRTPQWLDIYFNPGSRLSIRSTDLYLLWISWGYRAEIQFTINRGWCWPRYCDGFLWFAFRQFK